MKKKNWLVLLLACTIALTSFQSCSSDDTEEPDEWFRTSVFLSTPRNGSAYFTIGDQGYLVGGIIKTNNERLKDTWSFDGSDKTWSPKAEFPGDIRNSAVGFAIGTEGFVGTGWNGTSELKDFYKYNSTTDTWTKIADFPGEARFGAVAFSLGGFGYVGLGTDNNDKTYGDFYKYDPTANTWTLLATNFTYKKAYAFSFVIGNNAYVGGGYSNNALPEDFYKFDGTTWTQLEDLARDDDSYVYDVRRYNTAAFAIGNYGYVTSGRSSSGITNTTWKYDPSLDAWIDGHQEFLGSTREKAVSFSLNNKGYVATGINGTSYFDDNWEFIPVR
ncbi:Kelch repeat-containing protein [Sphingobacterium hungaricum]|uniref:Galactose oxidase, central domain n=1 Tax=Sphingobacterium hungaricum TaxID=2082723 RepID=A0A928UZL7_9SPHI|nr:kelch repeat-containing protein [Sphingobacterium hungaricum]MBE8713979.1 hypothetical protein [Sphingobacterium hungaricum]